MDRKPAPRQVTSRPSAVTLQVSRTAGPFKDPGCSSAEQIRQRNIVRMTAAAVPRQDCVHMPATLVAFLPSFLPPESPRPGHVLPSPHYIYQSHFEMRVPSTNEKTCTQHDIERTRRVRAYKARESGNARALAPLRLVSTYKSTRYELRLPTDTARLRA